MENSLLGGICSVGIFVVCAQVLIHLRPEKSYEKYLKLLMSLMVLVQILMPVAGAFSEESRKNFQNRVEDFYQELEERQADAREVFWNMQNTQNQKLNNPLYETEEVSFEVPEKENPGRKILIPKIQIQSEAQGS